jgi:hypothetical protein
VSKLPHPILSVDFQIDPKEDLTECIDLAVAEFKPEGTKEIGISFGPKGRLHEAHCFLEFYGDPLDEGDEVITERMRSMGVQD